MEGNNKVVYKEVNNIKGIERAIMRRIVYLLRVDNGDEEAFSHLEKSLVQYYQFYTANMTVRVNDCADSLLRILKFLLFFPVRFNVDVTVTELLYKKYSLVNCVTYGLYQLCDKPVNNALVSDYLDYIHGSSIEKLTVFYLYRINPDYIKSNCCYSLANELTPNEIYYGITTGYISMKDSYEKWISRLYELSAFDEIRKLKADGFRISS